MEFLGEVASRAVKYNGFGPCPIQNFLSNVWGEKTIWTWKCTLQMVCMHLTTSSGARWCIIDSAKIFHCLILPCINQTFLAEIFLGGPQKWNISMLTPPPTPLLVKGADDPSFCGIFFWAHPHPRAKPKSLWTYCLLPRFLYLWLQPLDPHFSTLWRV